MAKRPQPKELPADRLRWHCKPSSIRVKTTDDATPTKEIIGQERALRALKLGLEMKYPGYNVFVTGFSGTGRMTTIKRLLADFKGKSASIRDRCYVHNFKNNDQPVLITLKAGEGSKFRQTMTDLIQDLAKNIPAAFERKRYKEERKRMMEHFQERQHSVLSDFEKKVKEKGFEVVQVQVGPAMRPDITPVVNSQPVSFDEIREVYTDQKVLQYLEDVQRHIMEDLNRFRPQDEQPGAMMGLPGMPQEPDSFLEYQVNVVVDNSETKGVPIVIETNPRFRNIFGTIEREVDRNGVWRTDFTLIKPGSLLKADGGYLVINALDALIEQGVWQNLKRTLRNGLLEIQPLETGLFGASSAFKPEPVEIDVKVVMLGDASIYFLLYEQDDDFKKIFKVRSDFDTEMPQIRDSIDRYVSFMKMICDDEKLKPFDRSGIAAVIEHGVRLAGRQNKISTRFNLIADLMRESNYWAGKENKTPVTHAHVRKAIEERVERIKLAEEKMHELIMEGMIMIDSSDSVVGQVNGLTIYDMHEYMFGIPSRITDKTSIGRRATINIERESGLSGPSHSKGVMIISGYLHGMYAQRRPLTMNASITFEQSYGGVDGDSASSTEIYAILSSLADVPLRQDIAVTGSVNQKGEIQPIGGVNQKIEGFFTICKARGLTGKQGVIIPKQNERDLMLRHDVLAPLCG